MSLAIGKEHRIRGPEPVTCGIVQFLVNNATEGTAVLSPEDFDDFMAALWTHDVARRIL